MLNIFSVDMMNINVHHTATSSRVKYDVYHGQDAQWPYGRILFQTYATFTGMEDLAELFFIYFFNWIMQTV